MTFRFLKHGLLAMILLAVATFSARAEIIITLDPNTETFTLSGSVMGTPQFTGLLGELQFGASNDGFGVLSTFFDLSPAITGSPNVPNLGAFLGVDNGGSDGAVFLEFSYFPDPGTQQTITAIEPATVFNYGSMSPLLLPIFEDFAANDTVLPVTVGTSTDQAFITLIPEPTAAALILAATAGLLLRRRRR
ncbi:MAG: PEP-CTERM sorting domain-containing protein [Verrucomicrobiota bacterium]